MPPLYILSSKAKDANNFGFDPAVYNTLPTVNAKYADATIKERFPYCSVRSLGSMDTSLWHILHREIYLPCFENKISKEPVRDPVTKKLISGPLIVKTDAGPGRLSIEADSIDFRTEMADMGVHILLSLPNATAATAEMDQLYTKFQPRCKRSTVRVASLKMLARAEARRKAGADDASVSVVRIDEEDDVVEVEDKEDGDGDGDEEAKSNDGSDVDNDEVSDADTSSTSKKKSSVCTVRLGNLDLGNIVNGFPGDPIELRPFDYSFQKETIIRTWKAVGFVPMTANAVNDPKVRHELGDGGAPDVVQKRLKALNNDYGGSGKKLDAIGMNGHVLDVKMPRVVKQKIPATSEAKIQKMVNDGSLSKAGSWFKCGVSVANSLEVMEAIRRVKEKQENEKVAKQVKEKEAAEYIKWMALKEFVKWYGADQKTDANGHPILTKKAAVAIVKLLLPMIAPDLKLKDYTTLKKCSKWLGEIAGRGTTWVEEMSAIEASYDNASMPLRRLF